MNFEDTQAVVQRVVNVLLVSPFESEHQALRKILQHSRWQQHGVQTQTGALEFLRRDPVPVVICDSDLPDGSWRDVLAELGEMPRPPLMVVAARLADERLWAEALNLGAYNVLAKPLNSQEVFHVVSLAWLPWQRRWEFVQPLALARSA